MNSKRELPQKAGRMKKAVTVITFILAVVLLILLTACGENGKSAYELAVEQGYDGTITEWLEDLSGKGGDGKGVASIEKTSSQGLIDTYTITYTDGSTQTFQIKNGEDGASVNQGWSAYEVAVNAGFEGTVQDWLNSLKSEGGSKVTLSASKALLSVVAVKASFENVQSMWGSSSTANSAGSGVILQDDKSLGDAYIITNFHVVYNGNADNGNGAVASAIKVYLYGYEVASTEIVDYGIPATLIGGSMTNDIAVLKISGSEIYKNSASRPADIADSLSVVPGQTAIAVGNPDDGGIAVNAGIVSKVWDEVSIGLANGKEQGTFRVMRYDASVTNGNSGGGLFDEDGRLIGIVNAGENFLEDFNYAIPSNLAVSVARSIIRNCDGEEKMLTQVCTLGISTRLASSYAVEGDDGVVRVCYDLRIEEVSENTPAFGKLEVGDIIKSFTYQGQTVAVTTPYTLLDYRFDWIKDTELTLRVERGFEVLDITLNLSLVAEVQ